MNLTTLARDQSCTIRLPGCTGGGEDTVLAHYRSIRFGAGVGRKPPDWIGAYSCAHCHDVVDARVFAHDYSRDRVRLAHAEGVIESIGRLIAAGRLVFK